MPKIKPVVVALAVLAALLVVGLLGSGQWNPAWNPFHPKMARPIETGLEKLIQKDSMTLGVEIEVDLKDFKAASEPDEQDWESGLQAAPQDLLIVVSGADHIDGSDPGDLKHDALFNIKAGAEGMQFSAEGQIKALGTGIYFQFTKLPGFEALMPDFSQIKNQWYHLSLEDMRESEVQGLNKQEKERFSKDMRLLLSKSTFFVIKQKLGSEDLKDEKAEGYIVGFDKEGVRRFVPAFLNLREEYVSGEQREDYAENKMKFLNRFNKEFDEAWPDIKEADFQVWIGKSTGSIRKIAWQKTIDLSQVQVEQIKQGLSGMMDLRVELVFSDFNKKFEITAPKTTKPAQELMKFFGFGMD